MFKLGDFAKTSTVKNTSKKQSKKSKSGKKGSRRKEPAVSKPLPKLSMLGSMKSLGKM